MLLRDVREDPGPKTPQGPRIQAEQPRHKTPATNGIGILLLTSVRTLPACGPTASYHTAFLGLIGLYLTYRTFQRHHSALKKRDLGICGTH